jgi:peroxiredoxin
MGEPDVLNSTMLDAKGEAMALLDIGAKFPKATLRDVDGNAIEFPAVLAEAPASVVFFYRGQW